MAEAVLRSLSEHERSVLEPEVARLAELEDATARQRDLVRRMLALLEPEFAAGWTGVRFDAGRMAFVRAEAGEGGAGEALVAADGAKRPGGDGDDDGGGEGAGS